MEKFKVENYEFLVFYFEVDEQIRKNLIKKFIFCQLKLQNIKDYKKYNLFYVYVKELKQYQVVLYLDILPFLFLERNINNGIEVLVYNSYIIIYKDSKLYYFFKINYQLNDDEIIRLIYNKFAININNITTAKFNYKQKIYSNIIKPFNFPNLLLFFLIISISLSCLSYFSFFNNEKKIEKKPITHISLYKYKAQKLVNILEVLKNYDLNLDELSFENNQFNLFVSSININNIHKFIDSKIYKIDVVSLNYNNQRQKNELVCKISSL